MALLLHRNRFFLPAFVTEIFYKKPYKRRSALLSLSGHSLTRKRYSAAVINLFNESFDGFMSSVDADPKYGHLITFKTDSKSLDRKKNKYCIGVTCLKSNEFH